MSFTSYYMTFESGTQAKFEVKKLIEIFSPITNEVKNDGLELYFNSMNFSFLSADVSQKTIDCFSIERPCGFEEKFVFEFSKQVYLVLGEPDLDGLIIFNNITLQHLPIDLKNENQFYLIDDLEKFKNRFIIFPY